MGILAPLEWEVRRRVSSSGAWQVLINEHIGPFSIARNFFLVQVLTDFVVDTTYEPWFNISSFLEDLGLVRIWVILQRIYSSPYLNIYFLQKSLMGSDLKSSLLKISLRTPHQIQETILCPYRIQLCHVWPERPLSETCLPWVEQNHSLFDLPRQEKILLSLSLQACLVSLGFLRVPCQAFSFWGYQNPQLQLLPMR